MRCTRWTEMETAQFPVELLYCTSLRLRQNSSPVSHTEDWDSQYCMRGWMHLRNQRKWVSEGSDSHSSEEGEKGNIIEGSAGVWWRRQQRVVNYSCWRNSFAFCRLPTGCLSVTLNPVILSILSNSASPLCCTLLRLSSHLRTIFSSLSSSFRSLVMQKL